MDPGEVMHHCIRARLIKLPNIRFTQLCWDPDAVWKSTSREPLRPRRVPRNTSNIKGNKKRARRSMPVQTKPPEAKRRYTSRLIYDKLLNIETDQIDGWSVRGCVISLVNVLLVLTHVPASIRSERLSFHLCDRPEQRQTPSHTHALSRRF